MSIDAPYNDFEVAVVGGGVVGGAVALALARHGVAVVLLEAEAEPGMAASGTNSGVLHTGFDSVPGELETDLILRAAALRDPVIDELGVPIMRCGALMRGEVAPLADNARRNGVEVHQQYEDALEVPGEAVTDPVAYTTALVAAAARHGAEVHTACRVVGVDPGPVVATDDGERFRCRVLVNCAGLYADDIASLCGDYTFEIFPRKGEFLVFAPPAGHTLDRILLPVPTKRTKGVLVFPTIDGHVIAGPTAVDCEDKEDWSVRPEAVDEVLPKAVAMWPPLEGAQPTAVYAGLRPAGRDGVNYLIGPSKAFAGLVNVAAIRSTGLTASLGIAERICSIVRDLGIDVGPEQPLRPGPPPVRAGAWWRRTADVRAA